MHTGKSYKLGEFVAWMRRTIYVLVVLSVVPLLLHQGFGLTGLTVPFSVVFLLGSTVALVASFKNLQTYNRTQDAQQVWMSITSGSRVWGVLCRDLVPDQEYARELVRRHLAWLAALRHQMREAMPWETANRRNNAEYMRAHSVQEREQSLESELSRYLSWEEAAQVLTSRSKALQVLALQSRQLGTLLAQGSITPGAFADLQGRIRDFHDQQGRSERIKFFPFPRQHAFINSVFVWILCILLPFGMMGEFANRGSLIWLSAPLSLLISWMYTSLDLVGESTSNPFEGGANDVPITQISQDIEADLLEIFGESVQAPVRRAANDIAL